MSSLQLTILTPLKTLLEEPQVANVRMKLADGNRLSIYPRHLPLVAETTTGPVEYTTPNGKQTIALAAGIVQVAENRVTFFTSHLAQVETRESDFPDEVVANFDRLARELFTKLSAFPNGD